MEAVSLIKSNFQDYIDHGVTLVEFWGQSCEPCKLQLPIVDELAGLFKHQATIARVCIDDEKELEAEYDVTSIPTLILFKDGFSVEKFIGLQTKDALFQKIKLYTSIGDTC